MPRIGAHRQADHVCGAREAVAGQRSAAWGARLRRGATLLCGAGLWLGAGILASAAACIAGIAVEEPAYCQYFTVYKQIGSSKVDDRINARMGAGAGAAGIRSYALLIGIDEYPNFQSASDRSLPPAKNDLVNLVAFLREQGFDEIIVLHNTEATKANINYFLDVYLNKQLDIFGPGGRVLIAHSGHGGPGSSPAMAGSIILSAADGARDYANVYALNELAPKLRNLAAKSFHFVALLGSCFSGGIFSAQPSGGSNDWYPRAPGAHAVSSAPHDDFAYGVGGSNGSIFFDTMLAGIRSGEADVLYAGWASGLNGDLHRIGGGIVRLGALTAYISGKIDALGINPTTNHPFPQILLGSLSTSDHNGAFFFVGPPKVAQVAVFRSGGNRIVATRDTGSSVIANSDVKVFSPPDSYAVTGIDVSHYNGEIDWAAVASAGSRFVYMKATESVTLQDSAFSRNWTGAARAGLVRGAYHVFDYCEDIDRQFENIKRTVPKEPSAMPIAVDLQWLNGPTNQTQKPCGDIAATRARLIALVARIKDFYGKVPVFFANPSGLNDLIDERFMRYPLWLQRYDTRQGKPLDALRLKGRNPWSFWQYTSTGSVSGIRGAVDRNAFYGTLADLHAYVEGRGNPALRAATR